MPVTLPDVQDNPTYQAQAYPDKVDLAAIAKLGNGTGVPTGGCVVTPHTGARSVDVSAGPFWYQNTKYTLTAATALAPTTSAATDRRDIVQASTSTGLATIKAGTPCSAGAPWTAALGVVPPVKPVPDSGCVLLAELYIVGGSSANLTTNEILAKTADYDGGGGNAVRIVEVPFTYNTANGVSANFLTGVAMYTPAAGDVIYDFSMEIDTAWNGVRPQFDLGTFALGHSGLLVASGLPPFPLWTASAVPSGNAGLLVAPATLSWAAALLNNAITNGPPVLSPLIPVTSALTLYACISQDATTNTAVAAVDTPSTAPSLPLTVTGSNNEFYYVGTDPVTGGGGAAPMLFTVASGTYTTAVALAAAMAAATTTGAVPFSTYATPNGSSGAIYLTMVAPGAAANGNQIQAGTNDISVALGFGAPSLFAGGQGGNPGASQGAGKLYIFTGTPT